MAVIGAQNAASMSAVNFIQSIGLDENSGVKTVDFTYTTVTVNGTDEMRSLTMPLLSLIPIPSLVVRTRAHSFACTCTRTCSWLVPAHVPVCTRSFIMMIPILILVQRIIRQSASVCWVLGHTINIIALCAIRVGYQIDECTITFNAKISSMEAASSTRADSTSTTTSKSSSPVIGTVASQSSSSSNSTSAREFSMMVFVKAVQAPMPEGLRRVFEALESSIAVKKL
jgi:hypothetical protein